MTPHVRAHPEPCLSEAGRGSSEVRSCPAAIFEVDRLSVVYPSVRGQSPVPVLEDVSFALARGGSLTLVGSSGSGSPRSSAASTVSKNPPAARSDSMDTTFARSIRGSSASVPRS